MHHRILKAILYGGLIAGTLDIALVSAINLFDPLVILRSVASGVLGKPAAFAGGLPASALGMLLQWLMSLLIAAIYVFASMRLTILTRFWIPCGLVYGLVTFFVMNYIVVPFSAAASSKPFVISAHISDIVLMLLYGLIIAFFANRFVSITTTRNEHVLNL
ncbi:hypothetical protein ELE36_09640 [Pseudolysobacter antarcticus]|uniref:DUF1440 domain-containing protein n=1 Tax=Pseudolysobacter antarcticus TaxID=2511995 RepID=A0A411HJ93_9GAMM|nr:hypothetical protein [Pseudolysobacter antarcticus]QBB70606.1 hypothetical protein ELE36_09640 [Pseudolysobacter antarcticus]